MATRLYLPATAAATPIAPTPSTDWEDTSILTRVPMTTAAGSDAMTTVAFADNNAADRDVLFRQYVSRTGLSSGQTVTGGQAVKAQARVAQVLDSNMFFAVGIRVIASNGSTVRKVVLAVTRDGLEADASATLENRQFTATSAVTNYTTVAGDYLVIEIGMGGDPPGGGEHDSSIRLGDAAASDLPEDDTTTTDLRPWVELTDTLAFDTLMSQGIF